MSSNKSAPHDKREANFKPSAPRPSYLKKPTQAQRRSRPDLSVVIVPLGAFVALLPWLVQIPNRLDATLLALLAIVCAAGTVRSYSAGARPVGLVFYPFMFAWLGVGPIYQLSHGRFAWGDVPLLGERAIISLAVLYTLAAVLAFTVGYEMRRKRLKVPAAGAGVDVRPLVVWALIVAGFALAPFAFSASGGFSGMFASRFDRMDAMAQSGMSLSEVGGLRYALGKQLPIAVSIAATCLAVIQARKRIKQSGFMGLHGHEFSALILSLGLLVLYCNPSANSRYIAVIAFGSVALYLFQPRSRRGGLTLAVASVCGTLVIYPLLDIFRRGIEGTSTLRSGTEAFASMDFDGFQQVANALIFVNDDGHTYGLYTISALLFFLPRSMWEGKATPASIDVASNRNYSFTDLSLPFHSEMYIEFGVIGMVVAMILFGVFASRADASWLTGGSTRFGLAAPLIAVALLGFLRGPLGSLAPIYLTAVGLFLLGLKRAGTDPKDT